MKPKVYGVYTALITPFLQNEEVDVNGFKQNLRFMIEQGIDGVVPLGTTGESPTLTKSERELIIKLAVQEAKGKIPIMVGTGTYSTAQTIEYTKQAEDLGSDYALIVSPYYNKPTQEGIVRHFKTIADRVRIPIVVYNIQGRTGLNIQTETLKKLAQIPNIIGVKESSGSMSQVGDVIETIVKERPDFSVMSGDDANTLSMMALGGHGIISVLSNLIPLQIKQLVAAIQSQDYELARKWHYKIMPLVRAAFLETNPIPIKAMMHLRKMPAGGCRLPLCELTSENQKKVKQTLDAFFQ